MPLNTTILELVSVRNLDEVVQNVEHHRTQSVDCKRKNWPADDLLHSQWSQFENLPFGIEEITSGSGTKEKFICLEAWTERAKNKIVDTKGEILPREDRINEFRSIVLFFELDDSVFCIVFSRTTNIVNAIVQDLLQPWTEVSENSRFALGYDIFYWLVKKFMQNERRIGDNPRVEIRAFTGFSGESSDKRSLMTGEGDKIGNVLATLAVLFSEDPLKTIKLELIYEWERVTFEFSRFGSCRIWTDHEGKLLFGIPKYHQGLLLTLLIYKQVIPTIATFYREEIKNGLWNPEIRKSFAESIGKIIVERIETELQVAVNKE